MPEPTDDARAAAHASGLRYSTDNLRAALIGAAEEQVAPPVGADRDEERAVVRLLRERARQAARSYRSVT